MWNKAGFFNENYWARQDNGTMKGFPVKQHKDVARYEANRRQAQRSRDVFVRVENKKIG